ncbi:titin [Dunckerocampus dactyliophorus]|uniref:titin n=1 Tax=Dunckerocampus dactyliophorus TaxID=161453 RepID=UPI002406F05E|nr:titin [Dunckerocampus dactyliophorus]
MGDTQSAQRESAQDDDAAAVDDVQQHNEKLLKNDAQLSGNPGGPLMEADSLYADSITPQASAILSQVEEVSQKPPKEVEMLLGNITVPESSTKADQKDSEMEEKHDGIGETFKNFFSKFGLMFTKKQSSSDRAELRDVPEADTEKPEVEDASDSGRTEQTPTQESDSPCPTPRPTGEVLEDMETKEADKPDVEHEWTHLETTSEHPPASTTKENMPMSPIKRYFTTGFFSGMRKKSLSEEDEITIRELVQQEAEETAPDRQDDTEAHESPCTDAAKDNQEEIPSTILVGEPEMSQETENVLASPLKKLLFGSSLMKLSGKQKDEKPNDDGDCKARPHGELDQLSSLMDLPMNPKNESPAEVTEEEEESAWATFKKLLSPKNRLNRSLLNNKDTKTLILKEEEILHSVEESKKRKDSVVSWDAILCGSRRRSHRLSDSDEETPTSDHIDKLRNGVEVTEISNNTSEIPAPAPKRAGSPTECDDESPWNAFKRLLSPKRKPKCEEGNVSDGTQENLFFSAKMFPGHKKRKSVTKEVQGASPLEANQDLILGDVESEALAVVLFSEFDTVETDVKAKETDVESQIPSEPNQNMHTEPGQPLDNLQTVDAKVQHISENVARTNEVPADLTMFISKELCDIPEESEMTETTATAATATHDLPRENTTAEELTSEAITAPQPTDATTLADESEMMSTLSQVLESSNTSGNKTPVPAACQVKETEGLLKHVVETISATPAVVPLISSASDQILETFVQEETKTLEVDDCDAVIANEMDETAAMTRISEVIEACSTETTTQIPKEELDTTKMIVDEMKEAIILNQVDGYNEVHDYEACLSDANTSSDLLSESQEMTTDNVVIVGNKTEVSIAVTPEAESKYEAVDQDAQSLLESTDQLQDEDHPPLLDEELQRLADLEGDTKDLPEMSVQSGEKPEQKTSPSCKLNEPDAEQDTLLDVTQLLEVKATSEDLQEATEEPKPPTELLPVMDSASDSGSSETCGVQLVDDELIPVASDLKETTKPMPEVCAALENNEDAEKEEISDDITEEGTLSVEKTVQVTKMNAESDNQDQEEVNASKNENCQLTAPPEDVEATEVESDDENVLAIKSQDESKTTLSEETDREDLNLDTVPLTEDNIGLEDKDIKAPEIELIQEQNVFEEEQETQFESREVDEMNAKPEGQDEKAVNASKNEINQRIELPEDVEATVSEPDNANVQAIKSEQASKTIFFEETAGENLNEDTVPLAEVNAEVEDKDTTATDAPEFELICEKRILEAAQEAQFKSGEVDVQAIDHKVVSEDILAEEHLTEEPKEETVSMSETKAEPEDHQAANESQTELVKEVEVAEVEVNNDDVQSVNAEQISEGMFAEETVKVQNRTLHMTEFSVELIKEHKNTVDAATTELIQGEEIIEAVEDTDEADAHFIEDKDVADGTHQEKAMAKELQEENGPLGEGHASKKEIVKDTDAEALSTQRESDKINDQLLKFEEAIFAEETKMKEPKEEEVPPTVNVEPESKDQKIVFVVQSELTREQLVAEEDEEISDGVTEEGTDSVEKTVSVTEINVEPEAHDQEAVNAFKNEISQEIELPKDVEATELEPDDANVQAIRGIRFKSGEVDVKAIDDKAVSEDILAEELLTEEPKEETVSTSETNSEREDLQAADESQTELVKEVEAAEAEVNEDYVQSVKAEQISEGKFAVETVTGEVQTRTLHLNELSVELIKEDKNAVDAATTQLIQEQEVIEADVPFIEDKEVSDDTHPEKQMEEELQEEKELLEEGDASKNEIVKDRDVDVVKTELTREQLVAEEDEEISDGVTEEGTDSVEKTVSVTEINVEPEAHDQEAVNAFKNEISQEIELPKDVEATELEPDDANVQAIRGIRFKFKSGEVDVKAIDDKAVSEDILAEELLTEEPKEETVSTSETNSEREDLQAADESQTELVKEVEAAEAEVNEDYVQSVKAKQISEGKFAEETVTGEVQARTLHLNELSVELIKEDKNAVDAATTQLIQEQEVIEADVPFTEDKEVSDDTHPERQMEEELQEEKELLEEGDASKNEIVKDRDVDVVKTELTQEQLVVEEEEEISDDITEGTGSVEKTVSVTEMNVEPEAQDQEAVNASKNEISQEIQLPEDMEATEIEPDDTNVQAIQSQELKAIFFEITTSENHNEDTVPLAEDNVAVQGKDTKATDAPEFERIREKWVLDAEDEIQFESVEVDVQAIDHKVVSEDILAEEHLTEEPKQETVSMSETKTEPEENYQAANESQTELVKEVEVAEAEVNEDDVQSVNAEQISEGRVVEETVKSEVQHRTLHLTEFSVELIKENKNVLAAATIQLIQEQEVCEAVEDTDEANVPFIEDKQVSEDTHPEKRMAEELKEEKGPLEEEHASKMDNVKDIASEVLSTQTDSDEIDFTLLKSEEANFAEQTMMKEPKEEEEATVNVEPDSEEQKEEVVAKTEVTHGQAVAEVEEEPSESITKEKILSVEGTVPGTENNVEPEDQDQEAVDRFQTDFTPEAVQVEVLQSEEVEVLKSEEITDDVLAEEPTIAELKKELEPRPENSSEPETRTAPESKDNYVQSVQRDDMAEGILAGKTTTMNFNAETEEPQVKDAKSNPIQEQDVSHDEEDTAVETERVEQEEKALSGQEFIATTEEKPEKETLVEEIQRTETENEKASKREQLKPQLNRTFGEVEAQKPETNTENFPQDVLEEKEEFHTPDITEELDTFAAERVCLNNRETSSAQISEQVIYKDIPAFCGDLEVHLNDMGTRIEEEKRDFIQAEGRTAADVHALVMQVTRCHLKEVSASITALVEKPSVEQEPLTSSSVNESDETAVPETQLMKNNMPETAQVENEVMMMHVPVTLIKDNHRIQVQVVNVDVTSAERIHNSTLEVGVKEDKEVINVCHRSVENVENVSAFLEVEKVSNEENVVILQEVVEHVKRTQPETLQESVIDKLGEEVFKEVPDWEHAGQSENLAEASQEYIPQSSHVSVHQEKKNRDDLEKTEVTEGATFPSAELPANEDDMDTTAAETFQSQTLSLSDPAVPTYLSLPEQENALTSIPTTVGTKEEQRLVVSEDEETDETTTQTEEHMSQIYSADSQNDTEPTKEVSQRPVVEEHMDLVDSHEEFEMTEERAPVEEEPLSQIDTVDSQIETNLTHKVVQVPVEEEPLSQTDQVDNQQTKDKTADIAQHPVEKKPLTQIDQFDSQKQNKKTEDVLLATVVEEPSSQIDTVKIEKDREVTDQSVQGSVVEETLSQLDPVDNQKEVTMEVVQVPATEVPQVDTGVSPEQKQAPGTGEQTNECHKQTELPKEDALGTNIEEHLAQIYPKKTELTEEAVQAQELDKSLSPSYKQTALTEHVHVPETGEAVSRIDYGNNYEQAEKPEVAVQAPETKESSSAKDSVDSQEQTVLLDEHVQVAEAEDSMLQTDTANIHEKAVQQIEAPVQAKQTEKPLSQNDTVQNQKQTELTKEHVQEPEAEKILCTTDPFESQKTKVLTEGHVKAPQTDESISEESPFASQKQTELPKEHVEELEESLCRTEPVMSEKLAEVKEEHVQEPKIEECLSKTDTVDSKKPTVLPQGLVQDPEVEESTSQTHPMESHIQADLAEEHVQKQEGDEPLSLTDAVGRGKDTEILKEHVLEPEEAIFKTGLVDSYKKTEQQKEVGQKPQAQTDQVKENQAELFEEPVPLVLQEKTSKSERQTGGHVLQQEPEPVQCHGQTKLPEVGVHMKEISEPDSTETKYPPVQMVSAIKPTETTQPAEETSTHRQISEAPVKEAEEGNEQDVWMDAEEDIGILEDAEAEQSLQNNIPQEPEAVRCNEFQIPSNPEPEAQDSEGEENATVMEWD